MNSSESLNLFLNPFLMWSRLAWKTGEMAMASVQVIGFRTKRIALAGALPKLARDTKAGSIVAASKLSGSTAQLARRALEPVHARVSGNARRLGKKSK